MSKTSQQRRSAYQLGYKDGMSGNYVLKGRFTRSRWAVSWSYRRGFKAALREQKYGKRAFKSFATGKGAVIALDIIVGFILVILVLYVAGLVGK